jgi:hypothetical protein
MNQPFTGEQYSAGDTVFSSDGQKVGVVAAIHGQYLLVEKGFLHVTDYHVPFSAINRHNATDGAVFLNVSRDEALHSGWDQHPADLEDMPVDTLLTGAATMPDPPDIEVIESDDEPLRSEEAAL